MWGKKNDFFVFSGGGGRKPPRWRNTYAHYTDARGGAPAWFTNRHYTNAPGGPPEGPLIWAPGAALSRTLDSRRRKRGPGGARGGTLTRTTQTPVERPRRAPGVVH